MKWLLYLALAGAIVLGYQTFVDHQQAIGEQRATDRYEIALSKQKVDAARLLAAETARANEAERRARELLAEQEKRDAKNLNTVAGLQGRLRALAGPAGQLRDPNAQPGRGCGSGGAQGAPATGATDRPADGAETGGLLSAELSGLLQTRLTEADQINIAYASCRADLMRRAAGAVP
ncbi:MAG: hypothetical protein A2Z93_04055 [Curvibacter sp. GWA2_64_110]|nr:MAG: hypothetical protein A2Z93_04055 [Curvibacter sp. GWA2_64_110]HCY15254.1 hypothetical protein [Curvibacter sp.]